MPGSNDGLTKRKPDAARIDGRNEIKAVDIDGTIDFTITNAGNETIFYGFGKNITPDIPIAPGEYSPWPLYRPCEVWDGDLYIKFGPNGSVALVTRTI